MFHFNKYKYYVKQDLFFKIVSALNLSNIKLFKKMETQIGFRTRGVRALLKEFRSSARNRFR